MISTHLTNEEILFNTPPGFYYNKNKLISHIKKLIKFIKLC